MNDTTHSISDAPGGGAQLPAGGNRFDGIQVLRFLAAFSVVISHAFILTSQKLPVSADLVELTGWVGGWSVTLFFCISGFVITHGAQGLTAGQFFVHRLVRVYLAYWLATIGVCALKFAVFGSLPLSELSWVSALLVPAGTRPYPLWIEWSLIFEVFFYTLFSLIWLTRSNKVVLIVVTGWLIVIIGMSWWAPNWAADRYPTLQQIAFSSRNIPFILGIYCYFLRGTFSAAQRPLLLLLFPAGMGGIPAFASTDLKVVAGSVAAFGLLGFVVSGSPARKANSLLVKLGDYSYGVYLVHISFIATFLSVGFKAYQNPWLIIVSVAAIGTAAGALFGFAELRIYRYLRRRIDTLFARRKPAPVFTGLAPTAELRQ